MPTGLLQKVMLVNNNKKLSKHYDEVLNNGVELIKFYHENPCIAAHDLLGVDLAPIQRAVFEDMWFKNFVITVATRGFGKTFMLGTLATLGCLLKPGYRVGLIGKVFRQCLFNDFDYLPIFTDKGLITNPMNFYDSIDNNTSIQSLNNMNTIKNKWINEEQEGLIIKTEKGFEIGGLYEHCILTINDNLDLVYKELKDITMDDNLVIKKGFKLFGNDDGLPKFIFDSNKSYNECRIPQELTPDLSYWMGLVVGDGCIYEHKKHYVVCFTNQDEDLLNSFKKHLITYFVDDDLKISDIIKKNTTHEIRYHGKKLFDFLIECGFTSTTAIDKSIPHVINKASKECVSSFLSGLMDTDGCVYIQQTKKSKNCTVHLSTSSLQMAKQVQAWFLNFGIVSNLTIDKKASKRKLNGRDKYSICATSYKVRISNIIDLIKFRDEIGFRCLYKKSMLDDYLLNIDLTRCNNSNVVPNANLTVKKLVNDCYKLFGYGDKEQNKFLGKIKNKCDWYSNFSIDKIQSLLYFAEKNNVLIEEYYKLKNLISLDLNFVKPVSIVKHTAKTIDIEVENESCYWANGFINHNSKMIFSEVEKLYLQSSILQEACAKAPTRGSDSCYLKFKSVGGMTPSYIEALPLGDDGSKIRGSRFYLVLIDELAQIPNQILDMVIRPMGATSLAPMERVRRIEQKNKLIGKGLALESDFELETVNKMVMTSSGYYKFNHMWRRMNDYWRQTEIAKKTNTTSQFAVWQIPHWDLPDGFLDKNNIDEARRVMSHSEFRMEYEAAMVSDSEGFFKASLLEACTLGNSFGLETSGDTNSQYVLGIDPNQGGKASCGLIVLKLGLINKIVVVSELKNQTTQQMTQAVQDVCDAFNITRVFMDRGGGGKAICDLLEDGYGNKTPLIDRTNEEHKHMQGRHVLEMVNFNPSWIADANFTTKSMFEEKKLLFPELSLNTTQDYEVLNYESVNILKSQLLNIIVTPTSTGLLHFDTPQKGQNKDLYSALILAAHGARIIAKEMEEAQDPILFNSGGLVRMHKPGSSFDILDRASNTPTHSLISAAVLKKKIK